MTAVELGPARLPERCRVAIVGGGITGLATALRLVESGAFDVRDVVVLEASGRLGGQIRTIHDGPYVFEAGADTMVTQKPEGLALCRRLGLESEIVRPYAAGATVYIARRGRLIPVPEGFALVGPTRLGPLLGSPLFSPAGKLRMIFERFLSADVTREDESVRDFVTRRFGREAFERAAEPVVGGLFTADCDRLSLRSTLPRFADLERRAGSVWRGLSAARLSPAAAAGPRASDPVALRGGMQGLVDRLAERLGAATVVTGARVSRLARTPRGLTLAFDGRASLLADAIVLASPAFVSAELVRDVAPRLAAGLAGLEHASCATVNLVYDRAAVASPPAGFGFFVPRGEQSSVLAASHVSRKFEGRAPADRVVLRAYLGGALHPRILDGSDEELIEAAHAFLAPLLGLSSAPLLARVHRHDRAMPQPAVGDVERVRALECDERDHDGLFLAGGALGAIGIPDCIRSGEAAADRALEHVASEGRTAVSRAR